MNDLLIVGRNPVREALLREDGTLEKVLLQKGAHGSQIDEIRRKARSAGVPVQVVPEQRLRKLAPDSTHQGVLAFSSPVAYPDLHTMLEQVAPTLEDVRSRKPLLLALDGIEDPHNYGAILRSAVAAGASGVIVPDRGQAPLSLTAIKSSAGVALHASISRVTNLADALIILKERGYWVVGLDAEERDGRKAESVWDYDWSRPVVVVLGSEGSGIRPRVRSECDTLVSIPMSSGVESLNVSVAAGITLFIAAKARLSV